MVPQSTCLSLGRRSIRYKKEMEHLPTEANPNINMKTVVVVMSREKKNPMKENVYMPIERIMMGRRP
jgi:hypothetical protein